MKCYGMHRYYTFVSSICFILSLSFANIFLQENKPVGDFYKCIEHLCTVYPNLNYDFI